MMLRRGARDRGDRLGRLAREERRPHRLPPAHQRFACSTPFITAASPTVACRNAPSGDGLVSKLDSDARPSASRRCSGGSRSCADAEVRQVVLDALHVGLLATLDAAHEVVERHVAAGQLGDRLDERDRVELRAQVTDRELEVAGRARDATRVDLGLAARRPTRGTRGRRAATRGSSPSSGARRR